MYPLGAARCYYRLGCLRICCPCIPFNLNLISTNNALEARDLASNNGRRLWGRSARGS